MAGHVAEEEAKVLVFLITVQVRSGMVSPEEIELSEVTFRCGRNGAALRSHLVETIPAA
jgi:hypothetical protein